MARYLKIALEINQNGCLNIPEDPASALVEIDRYIRDFASHAVVCYELTKRAGFQLPVSDQWNVL